MISRIPVVLSCDVTLGEASAFECTLKMEDAFKGRGVDLFRGQRVTVNAHGPGLFYIESLIVGGQDIVLGAAFDAWMLNPNAVGQHFDFAVLKGSDSVTVKGRYTGRIPFWPTDQKDPATFVPYKPGEIFELTVSLTGPAGSLEDAQSPMLQR